MPIDYLSRLRGYEGITRNLVRGRSPQDEITRTSANIQKGRQDFLGGLSSRIQGISGVRPSYSEKIPQIERKTQSILAKQKLGLQRQQSQAIFENAFQSAQDAGYDVRSAQEYARRIVDQQTEQIYAGGEASKSREFKRKMNELQNQYAKAGVALEDQDRPSNDYASVLARVLLGGLSQGISTHYLTKNILGRSQPPGYGGRGQLPGYGGRTNFSQLTPFTQGAGLRSDRSSTSPYSGSDYGYGASRVRSRFLSGFGRR